VLAAFANGDARTALSTLEMVVLNGDMGEDGTLTVTNEIIEQHIEYLEYFSNSYAMQNPLEDRANLMGYLSRAAMGDSELDPDRYFEPCLIKTEFYLRCLRDAFDTSSWPEKTVWEQALEVLMGGGN
jgi:hypothetical protein